MNKLNPPTEQFVHLSTESLFVKIWTPEFVKDTTPVVLLHDSLGCVETWRDFPYVLSQKLQRPVIAYDRLGFGKSSARSTLPSLNFIQEEGSIYLRPLISKLGINHFYLFGHSVGGAMALCAAQEFPDRCKAVITESAQAFVEERTKTGIIKANQEFQSPNVFEKLKKYHGEKAQWVLDAWVQVWLSEEFSSWSLKGILPDVTCPTLVIHGDQDEYGSTQFPEMISSLVSGPSQLKILPNFGHVPHRENPNLILNITADFINNLT